MTMLGGDSLAHIRASFLADIIGDDPADVVFIRDGAGELAPQRVRVGRPNNRGRDVRGNGTLEARSPAVVWGEPDLDVQTGDHFVKDHCLYRITFVQPNPLGVRAEAESVE